MCVLVCAHTYKLVHLFVCVYVHPCVGVHVHVQVCDVIVYSLQVATVTRRQTDMYVVDQKLKAVEFPGH